MAKTRGNAELHFGHRQKRCIRNDAHILDARLTNFAQHHVDVLVLRAHESGSHHQRLTHTSIASSRCAPGKGAAWLAFARSTAKQGRRACVWADIKMNKGTSTHASRRSSAQRRFLADSSFERPCWRHRVCGRLPIRIRHRWPATRPLADGVRSQNATGLTAVRSQEAAASTRFAGLYSPRAVSRRKKCGISPSVGLTLFRL